jgi:ABC-2 type transport system ATP-binding protein
MDRSRKSWEAQGHGAELPRAQVFDDWQACDGFVKDVDTALLAMAFSSLVSLLLLVFVERIKLLFYQSAENAYEAAADFNPNDKSKYLQTRNLTKTYSGNVEAVKGISFDVDSNKEILGLLGANGAGKSSTFNMVTMQTKRTSGDVFIFNQSIHDIKYLSDVNITAQADILWPYLSIKEHCQIIALISGQPKFERRFAELAKLLELDAEYKVASILSGGNRRKLCTALTLLTVPKLAYFDEPTVGLDPVARRNLLNLIKRSNASVLFTTHRLDEAEYLCSRVAIMQLGKILFDGNIEDIKMQT